jgi:hypothetical protein
MKASNGKCKTPFCGSGPWAWNSVPVGGFPTRERCLAVATADERQQALKLIQVYRSQEEIARKHDIESTSKELDQPSQGREDPGRDRARLSDRLRTVLPLLRRGAAHALLAGLPNIFHVGSAALSGV